MIRNDFVSNSSSSSFVLDSNQNGLKNFFMEFKELFGKLHDIVCIFNVHKDLMPSALKAFKNYKEVDDWVKQNNVPISDYIAENRSTISFAPQMLLNDKILDICWRVVMSVCDQIEIGLRDTWGPYNFAMHQILTLLEYKGFNFEEGYSNECWVKMNLKNREGLYK